MPLRVGIDLVAVRSVEDSLRVHGGRYLRRVYTEREVEDCRTVRGIDPRRLAGRFAVKEATLKVLRPRDEAIPWRSMETRGRAASRLELHLDGPAAALAAEAGLSGFAITLSHGPGFASAVVIASLSSHSHAHEPMR